MQNREIVIDTDENFSFQNNLLVGRLGGLVVIANRAGDPGSNPGPGENFSLKLCNQHYLSEDDILC